MNNKIDKGIIAIVITIIVLILFCIVYIIFEKSNEVKDMITTTTTVNTTTKIIGKINKDKEYVYDATYVSNINQETYTINNITYNIDDYKAPYINLNSDYADFINNEIKKLYDNAVEVFNRGVEDKISYIDTFKYYYYINDDILSLVLTTGYGGTDEIYYNYNVFVINLKTGEKVVLDDILNYKNIDKEIFIETVKNKIVEEYDKFYLNINKEDELYTNYYETLKEETLNKFSDGVNNVFFINGDGMVSSVVTISYPAGRGYKDAIIVVE